MSGLDIFPGAQPSSTSECRFPDALCQALFAEILVDDVVDRTLHPPGPMQVDFSQEELVACFRLSRQLWLNGCDLTALRRHAAGFARGRSVDPDALTRLKHIRAKFKHLRYAHILYGADHHYPASFNRITVLMGKLQDAMRTGSRTTLIWRGIWLRLLLSSLPARRLLRDGARLEPTTASGFRDLLAADLAALELLLARPAVTGTLFHAARKIVGRQGSFWNTLHTLWPSEERHRIIRWLSAINGAMGAMHDDLVTRRAADARSYHAGFTLPDDLRARLQLLTERLRAALAGS